VEIKKAIITAAGKNQRTLPLQVLVDRDGNRKPVLKIIIEEILAAGIEEICVVVSPGVQEAYAAAAGTEHKSRLRFTEQTAPMGYGHAVWCARDFSSNSPFLLLVGDHLYVTRSPKRCAQQLVDIAKEKKCSVSAVQATHESKLPHYGAVGGRLDAGQKGLYKVAEVVEKPTPTEAEQKLIVPGQRAGYYLCFFGLHVFTPTIMSLLSEEITRRRKQGTIDLSGSLDKLSKHERYLAHEVDGRRYDIGLTYGLLIAQLALALDGQDRDEVLTSLTEFLVRGTK
jgi:UTP--glucose-1-phosphate uridylyltransferase